MWGVSVGLEKKTNTHSEQPKRETAGIEINAFNNAHLPEGARTPTVSRASRIPLPGGVFIGAPAGQSGWLISAY